MSTELARAVGGFAPHNRPLVPCEVGGCDDAPDHVHVGDDGNYEIDGQRAGEDWDFTLRCRAAVPLDAMRHVPEVTWLWHHHSNNTSGLPDRW